MQKLSEDINATRSSLGASRSRLQSVESDAKRKVGDEVSALQDALKEGSNAIQHTVQNTRSFLLSIEDAPNAQIKIDIRPQMTWLHESLLEIGESLEGGHTAALRALDITMTSNYTVLDIRQDVTSQSDQLSEYHAEASHMASQARRALTDSETALKEIENQLTSKKRAILSTSAEADNKRRQRNEAQNTIQRTITEKNRAQEELGRREQEVTAGGVIATIGLLAAPVTLGISLVLTGAGAVVAASSGARANELNQRLTDLRSTESRLNDEIGQYTRQLDGLEREKRELEGTVRRQQHEISDRKSRHAQYNTQIREASDLQTEVSTLRSQANVTLSKVSEATTQLQGAKQQLDKVTSLVKEKSLEVSQSAGVLEIIIGMFVAFVFGTERRRAREFERHKRALMEVTETLQHVQSDMPLLIGSAQEVKLLGSRPWAERSRWSTKKGKEIPAISYHTDSGVQDPE